VGYGSIGKRHVNILSKNSNIKIIICTKRKLQHLEKKGIIVHNSLKNALQENPEVGIITNESSKHISTALTLAENGLDLFIEKPLSNNNKNIQKLIDVVEKKKLITQIGCQIRFNPCLEMIKKIVKNKKIGKVISIKAENGSYLPSWHPNENYKKSYSARKDLGGGVVLTCIHELDYLYWIFGDISEIFSMTCTLGNLKIDVDDFSAIILKFKNNIIGEIHLDFLQKPNSRSLKLIGTKGTLFWDYFKKQITINEYKKEKENIEKIQYIKNFEYIKELDHFLDCVKKRKNTINDLKQGKKVLEMALSIKESSNKKKIIKL
jgi:predicted dehydrogenase